MNAFNTRFNNCRPHYLSENKDLPIGTCTPKSLTPPPLRSVWTGSDLFYVHEKRESKWEGRQVVGATVVMGEGE